jgi:hypothetical protein
MQGVVGDLTAILRYQGVSASLSARRDESVSGLAIARTRYVAESRIPIPAEFDFKRALGDLESGAAMQSAVIQSSVMQGR